MKAFRKCGTLGKWGTFEKRYAESFACEKGDL